MVNLVPHFRVHGKQILTNTFSYYSYHVQLLHPRSPSPSSDPLQSIPRHSPTCRNLNVLSDILSDLQSFHVFPLSILTHDRHTEDHPLLDPVAVPIAAHRHRNAFPLPPISTFPSTCVPKHQSRATSTLALATDRTLDTPPRSSIKTQPRRSTCEGSVFSHSSRSGMASISGIPRTLA